VYVGFVKPAEVSHDASIYKMYEAEAAGIEAAGGRVHRAVLDFEFKRKICGELNKKGDYGDLSYARRQEDLAELHELPIVDGKVSLPDLRVEYMRLQTANALTSIWSSRPRTTGQPI
jgi:hypothetical protein